MKLQIWLGTVCAFTVGVIERHCLQGERNVWNSFRPKDDLSAVCLFSWLFTMWFGLSETFMQLLLSLDLLLLLRVAGNESWANNKCWEDWVIKWDRFDWSRKASGWILSSDIKRSAGKYLIGSVASKSGLVRPNSNSGSCLLIQLALILGDCDCWSWIHTRPAKESDSAELLSGAASLDILFRSLVAIDYVTMFEGVQSFCMCKTGYFLEVQICSAAFVFLLHLLPPLFSY